MNRHREAQRVYRESKALRAMAHRLWRRRQTREVGEGEEEEEQEVKGGGGIIGTPELLG